MAGFSIIKQSTRVLRKEAAHNKSTREKSWWWRWQWGFMTTGAILLVVTGMSEWTWMISHPDLDMYNQKQVQNTGDAGADAYADLLVQQSSSAHRSAPSDHIIPQDSHRRLVNTSSLSSLQGGDDIKTKTTKTTDIRQKYVVDCHSIVGKTIDENVDPGGGLFVKTKTEPSFWMNIHDPNDDILSTFIQRDGCFECGYIQDVQHVLQSYPTAYFLDIGTNIGMWTLSIAATGHDTYSLEPFPRNWNRVCRSLARNSKLFQDHITLLNIAATGEPAVLNLVDAIAENLGGVKIQAVLPTTNNTDSDASAGASESHNRSSDSLLATGINIDSLNLPRDRPVVIKLDVEGNEMDAMMGALDFLEHANIVYFFMEVWTINLRHKSNQVKTIAKILSAKGLIPYRYDHDARLNRTVEVKLTSQPIHPVKWKPHPRSRYFDIIWRLQPRK